MNDEEGSIFAVLFVGLIIYFLMSGNGQTGNIQTRLVRRDARRPDWRPNPGGNVLRELERTVTRVGRRLPAGEGRISDATMRPRNYR